MKYSLLGDTGVPCYGFRKRSSIDRYTHFAVCQRSAPVGHRCGLAHRQERNTRPVGGAAC